MKKVIIAVTNDLYSDRRVDRVAAALHESDYKVLLIGRRLKNSPPVKKAYRTLRYRLLFNRSFLFYANYNIVLFFDLLFRSFDIVLANDLDTLPACHVAAWIRRKKVVFDSHELFPEVPELSGRRFVKNFWKGLEKIFVKKQKSLYTVSRSIAEYYKSAYNSDCKVIMNVPLKTNDTEYPVNDIPVFPHPLIVYQGALNKGRGIERLIDALPLLTDFHFLVIGTGDLDSELKLYAKSKCVAERVFFTGRISPDLLRYYTAQADIGISLEENIGLNYYYALPNKLFDYLHAGIPVLVSAFPEMKRIVDDFNVGMYTENKSPEYLAEIILKMISSNNYNTWKSNAYIAANQLCWENEREKLLNIFKQIQ